MDTKRLTVTFSQAVPTALTNSGLGRYVLSVLVGLDVLTNALTGGLENQTISCRIGLSMRDGGWASKVPWPAWWVKHCQASIYSAIV